MLLETKERNSLIDCWRPDVVDSGLSIGDGRAEAYISDQQHKTHFELHSWLSEEFLHFLININTGIL